MAIEVFLGSTNVIQTIPLVDRACSPLTVTAVEYLVRGNDGSILIARAPLSGFVSGAEDANVSVLAINNTISVGNTREVRSIELYCTVGGNTVSLARNYALTLTNVLVEGENSFQTLATAELTALEIPNLTQWDIASEDEKNAALIDARQHILQLNFSFLNSNINWGQDSLNFIPEGNYDTGTRAGQFIFEGDLSYLTASQYLALPERFKKAIRSAQLAEANAIMGGDTSAERRAAGVIMDNIGESKQTYRESAPLQLPVCRRALAFLSPFVSFSKRIGRS